MRSATVGGPKWLAFLDRHLLFQKRWRRSPRSTASTGASPSQKMARKSVSLEGVVGEGIAVDALVALSRHPTPLASLNDGARPSPGSHITHELRHRFSEDIAGRTIPTVVSEENEHLWSARQKVAWARVAKVRGDSSKGLAVYKVRFVVPRLLWVTSRRFVKPTVLCH